MSQTDGHEHDTLPPSMDPAAGTEVDPPKNVLGIAKQLGPGLIIAGSIVGSGELIATTKTGAQAGISLLWLIVIGCVIKVFVQIELGRYTISHGETTLAALDRVPGPRLRVNWIVWFWLIMMIVGLGQVGGIVGGVGQSLALAFPLSGDYAEGIRIPSERELKRYVGWKQDMESESPEFSGLSAADQARIRRGQALLEAKIDRLNESPPQVVVRPSRLQSAGGTPALQSAGGTPAPQSAGAAAETQFGTALLEAVGGLIAAEREKHAAQESGAGDAELQRLTAAVDSSREPVTALTEPEHYDDKWWALGVALFTIAILFRGRYGMIQNFATVLVVTFTFVTVGNVVSLQLQPEFHLPADEILSGLWFSLPETSPVPPGIYGLDVKRPLATALATFGIIGVGATELIMYPYWCLEKGYAKFAGPRSAEQSWVKRARGWMMVMHYDAFASMVIYTVATLAFFVMGVAVMHKQGLDPEGMRMTSTLLEQYVPVFGEYARWLFLAGAISVLYSTFLVANAGFGRMYTDALKVYGLLDPHNQKAHDRSVSIFCTILPLISLSIFWTGFDPARLVLLGGTMQAMMLPLIGFAALYLRYRLTDSRLKGGRLWDVLLILSCIGLTISGGWMAYSVF